MKKNSTVFICSRCGNEFSRWSGKCQMCGEWNALKELKIESENLKGGQAEKAKPLRLSDIKDRKERFKSGIGEFDLVLGGGMVPGEVMLLGGEPGIGKSTLVWQVACEIPGKIVYVAGEESPDQIKLRARRLGKNFSQIIVFDDQDINSWLNQLENIKPRLLIIDSIQTVYDSGASGSAGGLVQVKESALKIIRAAKKHSVATILIGHVTKEGEVAGPRMLEHLVDAVFYLEGERGVSERFLRSQKNRFGPTDEMGVFRLTAEGLISASDFGRIKPDQQLPPGVVRTAVIEGSRVYFVEVQALVQKSGFGFPRRNAVGYDLNRLQMLSAVLSRRSQVNLSEHDIYINISDGYRLKDPIADLAVMTAMASSYIDRPVDGDILLLGELDLAGRVHLPEASKRIIKAAHKIGYKIPAVSNLNLNQILKKILGL
ncbi:MAG: DNA repair protein RadA [Candidatus Berkelbacteria bacterium]|nr:DNA repair protein RadA [Candidatus Berkelbacteria bacterium]